MAIICKVFKNYVAENLKNLDNTPVQNRSDVNELVIFFVIQPRLDPNSDAIPTQATNKLALRPAN